eukprot:scaffold231141_cov26-Tisochrysis_lutea.AAC.1
MGPAYLPERWQRSVEAHSTLLTFLVDICDALTAGGAALVIENPFSGEQRGRFEGSHIPLRPPSYHRPSHPHQRLPTGDRSVLGLPAAGVAARGREGAPWSSQAYYRPARQPTAGGGESITTLDS